MVVRYASKDPATNVGQGARLKQMVTGGLQNLSYVYDPVGNITKISDDPAVPGTDKQVQAFTYDLMDRLTSAQATGGTIGLDGAYNQETYTYDDKGRLTTLPFMGTYGYSTAHPHAVEKLGGVVKYVYDSNGNMTQRIVGGNTYNLTYNGDNRLVSVSGAATNTYVYNGDGERIKSTTYENLAFGLPATSGTTLYWPHVVTDGDNWADSGAGANGEFAYTTSGLQYVQIDLGAVYTVDKVKVWHYGGGGRTYHNTKTQVSSDGSTWYTVFDSAVSGEYAETAAGKTHTFTARSVRYVRDWSNGNTSNAGNHWVEIEAYGSRTVTTIGNYFEWRGSTSTMVKYYYAGSQRAAMRTGATDLKWLLGDHLGSTAITANGTTGARESELRYKPWGELRYAWNNTPTEFRFTGQRQTGYINLIEMGSRLYDPALGRFTSPDSIVPESQDGRGLDRYSYVANNPILFYDPSGHCWGVASGIRGVPSYSTTCNNVNAALSVVTSNKTTFTQRLGASAYLVTEVGAHLGVVVGGAILGCAAIGTACAKAGETVLVTETLSNSDGDPSPAGEIKALSDITSQLINRPLTQSDLGLEGTLETLKGTFSVKDGIATVTIDMIQGDVTNPFKIFENLINLAKSTGANTLMLQANIANERLYNALVRRYGLITQGGVDYITIPLIEKLTQQ